MLYNFSYSTFEASSSVGTPLLKERYMYDSDGNIRYLEKYSYSELIPSKNTFLGLKILKGLHTDGVSCFILKYPTGTESDIYQNIYTLGYVHIKYNTMFSEIKLGTHRLQSKNSLTYTYESSVKTGGLDTEEYYIYDEKNRKTRVTNNTPQYLFSKEYTYPTEGSMLEQKICYSQLSILKHIT